LRYEWFLAARYLGGLRRQQPVVSVIAMISVAGIALGVAALLVVLGVMSGFDADLEDKIIGANPHLLVQAEGGIRDTDALIDRIFETPGIAAASPMLQTQTLVRRGSEALGVLLRGVDPMKEPQVTRLPHLLKSGTWPPGPGDLVVGSEFVKKWGLRVGDSIDVTGGEKGKPFPLRISAIFTTGMYDYDMYLTLTRMETAQLIVGGKEPALPTGVGVRLDQPVRAPEIQQRMRQSLGYPYYVVSWMDMNSNLFAALKLEKLVMFIILTLIVLVACFNIIATLLMMVVSKTKEIGILKAVGATNGGVRSVFTIAGLLIGLAGTALGTGIGLSLCALLKKYQFIKLPADIYYIDRLPVKLEMADALSVVFAALAISWVVCLYPSWVAARLEPAKALRYE